VSVVVLYLLLLKATLTSFSGLASLPMIRGDFVVHYHLLTDRQLNTAVAALPEKFRIPLLMRYVARQSYKEIAVALSLRESTVVGRLSV